MKDNQDLDLSGLEPEQKIEQLQAMAVATEFEKVRRDYPEEIKEQLKDFVVQESTVVMEKTIEMKAIMKEFTEALKKHKEGVLDALVNIKKGYSENEEKVFLIDDQENSMMNVYDQEGRFLYSRKLKPSEKQTKILELKTGTND